MFIIILTEKCTNFTKVCVVCFSMFASFALFAVHVSNRSVHRNSNRETHENHESLYGLFLLVRALRIVRGSWNLKGSVPCSPCSSKSAEPRRSPSEGLKHFPGLFRFFTFDLSRLAGSGWGPSPESENRRKRKISSLCFLPFLFRRGTGTWEG